ncbi:MAG: hypothetical protein ACI4RA_06810 [Kiritimatiellia bacterium]
MKSAAVFLGVSVTACAVAETWFVDSVRGDDGAAGTSEAAAVRSLDRVNALDVKPGDRVLFRRGGLWRGGLVPKSGEPGRPVVYSSYGTGPKPILQQSVDRSRPEDWEQVGPNLWTARGIPADVGIFICDHGARWGVKKWHRPGWTKWGEKATTLANELDYHYIPEEGRVVVNFPRNPGGAFESIELAQTRHVVNQGGRHDVVYDGLWVRYGAAHGFGGGGTRNITIRNCDICWIGGGLQFWKKDAKTGEALYPVRYGNGIEFWGECHNHLVERNRLWQIYDAALTNQTKDDPRAETDVVWRDNVIWQAEYSFEYWNHDPRSHTANILFEHNTCIDAGYCWSHDQRPNPNGAHLMLYDNAAPTTNFVVRNNLFVRTTDRSTRLFNDWRVRNPAARDGLAMARNLYWIPENRVCEYHVNGRERAQKLPIRLEPGVWGAGEAEFRRYQAEFGLDEGSVYGEPQFVDEAKRDYRLRPGTFGADLATDGGPLGARGMPGLDGDQSR